MFQTKIQKKTFDHYNQARNTQKMMEYEGSADNYIFLYLTTYAGMSFVVPKEEVSNTVVMHRDTSMKFLGPIFKIYSAVRNFLVSDS